MLNFLSHAGTSVLIISANSVILQTIAALYQTPLYVDIEMGLLLQC